MLLARKSQAGQTQNTSLETAVQMKIDQLTGMRFFAALAVFLSHLGVDPDASLLGRIFHEGYVGVSFFFMLSGFVLSYSYSSKFRAGEINKRTYILLRIARLAPLHFLTALPFFVLSFSEGWKHVVIGVANLSFLQSWIPHSSFYFSLNAPSWSLSNEMFFYSVFVFLVFLSFSTLLRIFYFFASFVFLTAMVVLFFAADTVLFGSRSFSHWLFYIFPGFRLLEFLVGMIVFEIWSRSFRLPSFTFPLAIVLLVTAMYFGKTIPEELRYSLYYLPFVCLLLLSCLNASGVKYGLLCSRTIVFLGDGSFAFYLVHLPVLNKMRSIGIQEEIGSLAFIITSLIIVLVSASLIHVIFERPFEHWLKRRILKHFG